LIVMLPSELSNGLKIRGGAETMVKAAEKKSVYFKFSPRILDHLGVSAYNSVQKCLSELAANSHDADAVEVSISLPDTLGEDAVIEVQTRAWACPHRILKADSYSLGGTEERLDSERIKVGS